MAFYYFAVRVERGVETVLGYSNYLGFRTLVDMQPTHINVVENVSGKCIIRVSMPVEDFCDIETKRTKLRGIVPWQELSYLWVPKLPTNTQPM